MPQFIFYRDESPIGLKFNEAAAVLKECKGLTIKASAGDEVSSTPMILVEAAEKTVLEVKNKLPGWSIAPNNKVYPAGF